MSHSSAPVQYNQCKKNYNSTQNGKSCRHLFSFKLKPLGPEILVKQTKNNVGHIKNGQFQIHWYATSVGSKAGAFGNYTVSEQAKVAISLDNVVEEFTKGILITEGEDIYKHFDGKESIL